jgi:hypothetical protein
MKGRVASAQSVEIDPLQTLDVQCNRLSGSARAVETALERPTITAD